MSTLAWLLHEIIVRDKAIVMAVPIVMETLMAHGLTPEEAVDVIVKGILK